MTEPTKPRSYSGKVTAIIIVVIVVIFVLLNVVASGFVSDPDRPVPPPSINVRTP